MTGNFTIEAYGPSRTVTKPAKHVEIRGASLATEPWSSRKFHCRLHKRHSQVIHNLLNYYVHTARKPSMCRLVLINFRSNTCSMAKKLRQMKAAGCRSRDFGGGQI